MTVAWQKIGEELFEARLEDGVVVVIERNWLAPPGLQFECISMDVAQSVTLAVSSHASIEHAKRAGEAWARKRKSERGPPPGEARFERTDLLRIARHLRDAHWQGGEINLTTLAEDVAWTLCHSEWLDDPAHPVWEVVIEVAQEAGGLR